MKYNILLCLAAFLRAQVEAAHSRNHAGHKRPDPYAPVEAECPSTALVRTANGISSAESNYIEALQKTTVPALKAFISKSGCEFAELSDDEYPTLALTTSGGGFRSYLVGSGVHKAFDGREPEKHSTSGLYQAITYESGVSGGSWLVSSLTGNDHPLVSYLQSHLLQRTLYYSALNSSDHGVKPKYAQIERDVAAKQAAGFNVSTIDVYGRQISYTILTRYHGGIHKTFSGVADTPSFREYQAPFPLIMALGANQTVNKCDTDDSTQFEISPFEFGSWDSGVKAFVQTKYLGSSLSDGKPLEGCKCVTGFDNLAIVHGASSNVLTAAVCPDSDFASDAVEPHFEELRTLLPDKTSVSRSDQAFALYPNPFFGYSEANGVSSLKELKLFDGSTSGQKDPIWPFLYRPNVNVLIVNDNSGLGDPGYPDGTALIATYEAAKKAGISHRLPVFPSASVFNSSGLALKPTFFGCNGNKEQLTIIYLPNRPYSYEAGVSVSKVQYTPAETDAMIGNGVLVGANNGTAGWDTCLSCVIMKKASESVGKALPEECRECLKEHCYN